MLVRRSRDVSGARRRASSGLAVDLSRASVYRLALTNDRELRLSSTAGHRSEALDAEPGWRDSRKAAGLLTTRAFRVGDTGSEPARRRTANRCGECCSRDSDEQPGNCHVQPASAGGRESVDATDHGTQISILERDAIDVCWD